MTILCTLINKDLLFYFIGHATLNIETDSFIREEGSRQVKFVSKIEVKHRREN